MNWKWLILGGSIIVGLAAACLLMIKISADKNEILAKKMQESAYSQGVSSVNEAAARAGYDLLAAEIMRMADVQAESDKRVVEIRREYRERVIEIEGYDDTIAVTRPEEVEAWANKTTADLFNAIAEETRK